VAWLIFLRSKITPQERLHAEQAKQTRIHVGEVDVQRLARTRQSAFTPIKRSNILKRMVADAHVGNVRIGVAANSISRIAVAGVVFTERQQTLGITKRQRAQQDCVDHRKHGGGRTDAERDGQHRDEGKTRTLA
jgi:hypothetical protein